MVELAEIFREEVEREFRRECLYDLVPKKTWCRPWRTKMKLVGTGEKVLLYLSRYLFRVAISKPRLILRLDHPLVTTPRAAYSPPFATICFQ